MNLNVNDNYSANDYISPEFLRELQLARLQNMVAHAYKNVELFRKRTIVINDGLIVSDGLDEEG